MTLQAIPVGDFWARVTLTIIVVSMASILFLLATSNAHAHSTQESTTDRVLQAVTDVMALGTDQEQNEEQPTCHHGTVPCSSNTSITSADLTNQRRTENTASFSMKFGPPSAFFLSIDTPPPKTEDS